MRRQLEGEQVAVAGGQLGGHVERRSELVLAAATATGKTDLEDEQLVEREPAPALLGLLLVPGTVQRRERVGAQRKASPLLERRRDEVREVACMRERLADEVAELLDRHLLARRVDGSEVRGRRSAVQVVRANRELVATKLAAQANVSARLQLLREPDLVEPDSRHLATAVGYAGLDDGEAPAWTANRCADDLARDRDFLLPGEQVGDGHLGRRRLVAEGPVRQEVADREQAELGELLRQRRADARQRLHAPLEPLRSRKAARTGPRGRLAWARRTRSEEVSSGCRRV